MVHNNSHNYDTDILKNEKRVWHNNKDVFTIAELPASLHFSSGLNFLKKLQDTTFARHLEWVHKKNSINYNKDTARIMETLNSYLDLYKKKKNAQYIKLL